MRRLVVINNLTLDGVMQAPGRPDEDLRDGFAHGGWALPYNDEVLGRVMGERMARGGELLLGRRTYEDFAGFWPHQRDNPFTPVLDRTRKHVASRTLREPLPWRNSVLVDGEATGAVARLKETDGPDLTVLGSGELCRALMEARLIDEYVLIVHPLVLGAGRKLFPDVGRLHRLSLVEAVTTTTGIVISTYQPA